MTREPLDGENVFLLPGFLTAEECAALLARGDAIGYEEAGLGGGPVVKEYRDNGRATLIDAGLAAILFERARPHLARLEGRDATRFTERFRFYRYTPGQMFKPHFDGSVLDPARGEASRYSFLMYLGGDCEGGETNFYLGGLRAGPSIRVRPAAGAALVFLHRLLHEGAPVLSGRKDVFRTDVMYPEGR